MNLPNKLSLTRCILVPVFVILMSIEHRLSYFIADAVFLVACITDFWDGKIARERGLVTHFGVLIDPLADKMLMAAGLIVLLGIDSLNVPVWTVIAILCREYFVTGARAHIASRGGQIVPANIWGKAKTVVQMLFAGLSILFVCIQPVVGYFAPDASETYGRILSDASYWLAIGVAVYTVFTGVQFAQANWKALDLMRSA